MKLFSTNVSTSGNYVILFRELRKRLDELQNELGRSQRYLITLASAAGEWSIRPGYDLPGTREVSYSKASEDFYDFFCIELPFPVL